MTDERDLRKQIAEDAQVGAEASAGVRAFQFFLVPLGIIGVCIGVFWVLMQVVVDPRTPQDWLQDVRDGGPNVRPHAALKLVESLRRAEAPDRRLTPDLIELIRTTKTSRPDDDVLRKTLIHCLGVLRDGRASETLLEIVRNTAEHLEVRTAAMDALGAIKDASTLPALAKMLDDADPVIRKYAAFNAGAVGSAAGDTGVVGALRARLSDESADVGWNAAFALAYFLGDGSGTDTLKKMLDRGYLSSRIPDGDPNRDLLAARAMISACNAAAKLKDASFVPLLERLTDPAKERDQDVRFIARQAIQKIEGK